jgi:hypothetical protein
MLLLSMADGSALALEVRVLGHQVWPCVPQAHVEARYFDETPAGAVSHSPSTRFSEHNFR